MTRRFLSVLGAGVATAFVLASACTVTSTEDDQNVASSNTVSSSKASTGSGGAGVGGGSAGAGVGGGVQCISCSEYLADPNATEEDVCGFNPGAACDAGSSCELAAALSLCVCGDTGASGMCEAECMLTCTMQGQDGECQTCVEGNCGTELADCQLDN